MKTGPGQIKSATLQNAAAATGNGTALRVSDARNGGFTKVAFQTSGTFSATVTFEGTVDGTNYELLSVHLLGVLATVSNTATTADIFVTHTVEGLSHVRARISAYTSGNVTVTARAIA